jgi:hypothetical protein
VTGDTFLALMENAALCDIPVGTVLQLDHFTSSIMVCAFLGTEFPDPWIFCSGGL